MEPLLEEHAGRLAAWLASRRSDAVEALAGRFAERLLAREDRDLGPLAAVAGPLLARRKEAGKAAAACLEALGRAAATGEVAGEAAVRLKGGLTGPVASIVLAGKEDPLFFSALALAVAWGDGSARDAARGILRSPEEPPAHRSRALAALAPSRDAAVLDAAAVLRGSSGTDEALARDVLAALARFEGPEVAREVLGTFGSMPASLRPQALDLLAARPEWAAALLDAVDGKRIEKSALNVNQLRRILALGDARLKERVETLWGRVRAGRSPEREKLIARFRKALDRGPGDPWAGKAVFEKTCAQCHVIFGKGNAVGPDITATGRETLDLLLSNLLDPNLVVGKGYQAWTLLDASGRVLSGLLVEDSPQRVVLKVAGGKEEVVPRGDVKTLEQSEVSLMPEDLEKTVTEEELRHLIAFLRFEEAPPEPVEITGVPALSTARRRLHARQSYGTASVLVQLGDGDPSEVFRFVHSNDERPFVHPLRAPDGLTVLTASGPDDPPRQRGVFTGHPSVNGLDFWHDEGRIRSRGLESVREAPDKVEIVARNDWLADRRGGRRVLQERQTLVVHAPDEQDRYRIDLEWRLTPDEDVTFGRHDHGGLALRLAAHWDRRPERAEDDGGRPRKPWQELSGVFDRGGEKVTAGITVLDHPRNPGFPAPWRADGQGLADCAITARGPLALPRGKTATFRWRLIVHEGRGDPRDLEEELREWADGEE